MSQARKATGSAGATDGTKAAERRARILDALRRCILRQGYSATSFNELAQEAGMSPSHVFYYFQGKDAVLKELYRDLAQRLIASVSLLQEKSPEEQFQAMSDYAFAGEAFTHDERLVFTELIGQSLHNPSVREIRNGLTTAVVQYLTNVFEDCERAKGLNADNSGLVAAALGTGLIVFCCCDLLPPDHARILLHEGLRKIGGFEIQAGMEIDPPAGD